MLKKVIKYFSIIFIVVIFLSISYLTFSSDFRRNTLTYSVAGYKFYQKILIKSSLPDIKKASDKLLKFIAITNYLSSEGKNNFLISILQNAEIIEEKISNEEDYLYFAKIVDVLRKRDPNLYISKIWEIKIAILKKDENDKITELINSAIELAPVREEAYRHGLDYYAQINNRNVFNNLCDQYHNLNLGGTTSQYIQPNFYGFSFSKFAIEPLSFNKNKTYYVQEGVSFNIFEDYVFSLTKPIKINGFNLHTGFLRGSKIEITSIEILNTDNKRYLISLNESYAKTKNSYLEFEDNKIKILGLSEKNEIISILFNETYESISQIILKIKFSRLQLTNKFKC